MMTLRRLLHVHLRETLRPAEQYGFVAPAQPYVIAYAPPGLYFQKAPATVAYPYLVYSLLVVPQGDGFELVTLDIDGWDAPTNGDTTALEKLMSEVDQATCRAVLRNDQLSVRFYLDRKIPLIDESDPLIRRRKYIYTGRLFGAS